METPLPFIIQAAGVHDLDEAIMLAACGITHIGIPLRLAHHAPDLGEEEARRVVAGLPPHVVSVCITYEDNPEEAARLAEYLGVGALQLHGEAGVAELRRLRSLKPGLFIIKSLVVEPGNAPDLERQAKTLAPLVDAFLTDTFDPATGARGATGLAHDWAVSRRLREISQRPLILAGGLNPDNVAAAVRAVRPAGVDAHTGLENASGRKDEALVRRFVAAAEKALSGLHGTGLASSP